MGKVNGKHFKEGDAPTATELNEVYVAVENMDIDGENTDANWATREHFDRDVSSEEPMNRLFNFQRFETSASYVCTSETWQTISMNGGEQAYIDIDKQAVNTSLLRVHWDLLVGELSFTDPGNSVQAGFDYAFRIKVTTTLGTKYLAPGIYSFSNRSIETDSSAINTDGIQWRSCSGTELILISPLDTVERVELQAVIGDASHQSVEVTRYNINVVLARS